MKKGKCLIEKCRLKQWIRGLCVNHYHQLRKRVKRKIYTWEQLEEYGMATGKSHNEPTVWMVEEMLAKVDKKGKPIK